MVISNDKSEIILVTGGSGMLGQAVVEDLQLHGYRVISADLKPSPATPSMRTVQADLTDLGQVYGVATGVDAFVHLAAIPAPRRHSPEIVFKTNVISTFNVLQAAGTLGIKRVVIASSLSALGLAYNTHPVELSYFPIDEAHPLLAQDEYGISKVLGESMADGFARRYLDLSITSFRFPFMAASINLRKKIEYWCNNPEAGARILWSYLDVVDAATVIRLALHTVVPGHEIFYVAAPNTFAKEETLSLIKKYYPGVLLDEKKLLGFASPIDSSAVTSRLQFTPSINWRDLILKE